VDCVIHIGPPKTGSTAIQYFLKQNCEYLSARGVFVPRTRRQEHAEVGLLCHDEIDGRLLLRYWGVRTAAGLVATRATIWADLERQFEHAKATNHHTVVLTYEGLAGTSIEGMRRLRCLLDPHFDRFRIVVFLRRPDLTVNSCYKNFAVRGGATSTGAFRFKGHGFVLKRWASVFGKAAIHPRIFPDSHLDRVGLMPSFLDAASLHDIDLEKCVLPGIRNRNWDARSIALIERINRHIPPNQAWQYLKSRKVIERLLAAGFPDHVPFRLSRNEAKRICDAASISTERLRRRWFPTNKVLFHDDFSMYPEKSSAAALSVDDCAYIIVQLVRLFDRRAQHALTHSLDFDNQRRRSLIWYLLPRWRERNWDGRATALIEQLNRHIPSTRAGRPLRSRKVIEWVLAKEFSKEMRRNFSSEVDATALSVDDCVRVIVQIARLFDQPVADVVPAAPDDVQYAAFGDRQIVT
jgi:hypothetical protein